MGLGLDVSAGLAAQLGEATKALKEGNAVGMTQLRIGWRKYQPIVGSITGIGSQTAATVIAGPEAGKLWHVHRITLGIQLGGTAIATPGTVIVGKGTGIQTTAQGSGQIIAGAASQFIEVERNPQAGAATGGAPIQFTWGRGQFVLVSPMNLIILWSSGTNNAPLVIDGDAYEYLAETAQPAPG